MTFQEFIHEFFGGAQNLTWESLVMIGVGGTLIALAIIKEYEPVLLLPIGFGCLLVNLPLSPMIAENSIFSLIYNVGIQNELFPLLIFIGIGAMIDFSPLISQPSMLFLGAAGQFGIFGTLVIASWLGFPLNEAASIGVIGAIDGPTSIFVASQLAPRLLAPIAVAAYSYMGLIPIIQPPLMRLLTTEKERKIRMEYAPRRISKTILILFPIGVTLLVGILVPDATPLVGMLMLGNLLNVSGVVERLSKSAQNEIANIVTLFLGLAIGSTMVADKFLNFETLQVMILGLIAFSLDTVAGLLFGKMLSALSRGKINPLLGAAGISAFPMAGRIAARLALEEDYENFILMHAMGANTSGQLGSVLAGGILLSVVTRLF